jgi:hypothetical protein
MLRDRIEVFRGATIPARHRKGVRNINYLYVVIHQIVEVELTACICQNPITHPKPLFLHAIRVSGESGELADVLARILRQFASL